MQLWVVFILHVYQYELFGCFIKQEDNTMISFLLGMMRYSSEKQCRKAM